MALLLAKWPTAKLVYPAITPWILACAIWLKSENKYQQSFVSKEFAGDALDTSIELKTPIWPTMFSYFNAESIAFLKKLSNSVVAW